MTTKLNFAKNLGLNVNMKHDERKFWQIMTVIIMTVMTRLLDSQHLLVVDGKAV